MIVNLSIVQKMSQKVAIGTKTLLKKINRIQKFIPLANSIFSERTLLVQACFDDYLISVLGGKLELRTEEGRPGAPADDESEGRELQAVHRLGDQSPAEPTGSRLGRPV